MSDQRYFVSYVPNRGPRPNTKYGNATIEADTNLFSVTMKIGGLPTISMSPDSARNIAAELIRLADTVKIHS